ncbi:acetyl-CoA carboxylase biotin carboxyl carrier protein subunit [Vagococcus sp. BWB3-3]|uniref:Acetyl-CoA carboxylase biotin carboxyl carrier protein subunit n=1 Tax=Vagococcus allomyrinae TaxID=2794353 RepID=A0A940PHW3_9ENTE|nr:acetyl-CoA carboxylase biotin carboxyl carrier protein subunit [Vagococcus allomyrinae]MBP1043223.1 acetyl-CoA carboxylase biotin carboxyl carrier protein subunit [Vagococcus allomyrinae]
MLRKFKISIDGKAYLVEMEEVGGVSGSVVSPVAAPVATSVPVEVAPTTEIVPVSSTDVEGEAMTSPMPGTIIKILVNVGDEVQENQPLMILEAMKMENQVVATKNGKVAGIHTLLGSVVNAGDELITIA